MYKACLIGHGYWGEKLARNFHNSEFFKLVSIVDNNKKNLKSAIKKYPSANFFNNYKVAVKKSAADIFIISTPTYTHYKIAKYALENSKHILVEKPLSLSVKEVKKLNSIAKQNSKLIFVDYPFLFSGTINYIKKLINNNKFGKILEIESFREKAPVRTDTNVIWDLCVHDVSILNFLLNKLPSKINVIKRKNLKKFPIDIVYINLKYPQNLNVVIKNSWISPLKIRLLKIKFEKAILYCDENESMYKIKIYKKNKNDIKGEYSIEVPNIDLTEPLSKMVKYIFNSIKNKNNTLFKNNFNEMVTVLLEKINKKND